ncbi:hypothetical protein AB0H76_36005 [Nocardia sp. NPDC050712]|uniref:hypothetical protein n=1 Tax=Nocardia sp. NPDC050712 TaxID=3155518 RepID=UPI0033F15C0C
MEFVIGLLIAWAIPKADRARKKINGLTGPALDLAIDRVWNLVTAELGGRHPEIAQLITEARAGTVAPRTRAAAQRALDEAALANPDFAAALRAAVAPPPAPAASASRRKPGQFAGVSMDGTTVAGSVTVTSNNKIANYAKNHPGTFLAGVLAALVLAALLIAKAAGLDLGGNSTVAQDPTATLRNPGSLDGVGTATATTRPSTPTDSSAIVGSWAASDATGTKTFTSSGGRCDGFYYSQGRILDIGGPMTCVISERPNGQGRYSLVVTQSPNRSTYTIEFRGADHAIVYDSTGARLYELERF